MLLVEEQGSYSGRYAPLGVGATRAAAAAATAAAAAAVVPNQALAGLGGFSERGNFLLPSAQSATRSPLAAA
jgi:hypothetical protein